MAQRAGQLAGVLAGLALVAGTAHAVALVTVDRAAGYIVFPKVVSDPDGILNPGATDTLIQITNTSAGSGAAQGFTVVAQCFYVDATARCSNGPSTIDPTPCGAVTPCTVGGACRTTADCTPGGTCAQDWQANNFNIQLSPNQPIGWQASTGILTTGLCTKSMASDPPFTQLGQPCSTAADCGPGQCTLLDVGRVPPLAPGVFIGELKCVEVDGASITGSQPPVGTATTNTPINANDLIGNATIYEVADSMPGPSRVDVRAYNAIGIQAVANRCTGGTNGGAECTTAADCTSAVCTPVARGSLQIDPTLTERVMCLGVTLGSMECPTTEYAQCPSTLILDHLFDVTPVLPGPSTTTEVTLVPCTENLENGRPLPVTAVQFLVFNEFEQRFSASTSVDCFLETPLSNIDRQPGQERTSIFNIAVQGTLTGQTKIRPVLSNQPGVGNGMLAVAEVRVTGSIPGTVPIMFNHTAAYNVNMSGINAGHGDFVRFIP